MYGLAMIDVLSLSGHLSNIKGIPPIYLHMIFDIQKKYNFSSPSFPNGNWNDSSPQAWKELSFISNQLVRQSRILNWYPFSL